MALSPMNWFYIHQKHKQNYNQLLKILRYIAGLVITLCVRFDRLQQLCTTILCKNTQLYL